MNTKTEATEAIKTIRDFIPKSELSAIADGMRSEEMQFFFDKACEIANTINTMPKTYEQDGKENQAIAYLHYFVGGCDWYITERDMEPEQLQAFGLANMGHGGELGYISIVELISNNVELDLYFTPKTLEEIQKED
jgi:hypothetical protein